MLYVVWMLTDKLAVAACSARGLNTRNMLVATLPGVVSSLHFPGQAAFTCSCCTPSRVCLPARVPACLQVCARQVIPDGPAVTPAYTADTV